MVIMDSEFVLYSRVWDLMFIEFIGRMLLSIRELIFILLLFGDNYLFRVSLLSNWNDGLIEKLVLFELVFVEKK